MTLNNHLGRARDRRAAAVAVFDSVVDEREVLIRRVDAIAHFIDCYDTVDASSTAPGAEDLVAAGADGTPVIAEFACVELGPLLGISTAAAWAWIRDVANLRHRHVHTWRAIHEQRVEVWQARKVAQQVAAAGLDAAAAGWVDQRIAPVLGTMSWVRVLNRLKKLITQADQALAAARVLVEKSRRFVRVHHDGDGMSTIVARTTTRVALELDAVLCAVALGRIAAGEDNLTMDALKADALGDLAAGTIMTGMVAKPKTTLVVHLTDEDVIHGGVAEVEGVGPVLTAGLRDLLGRSQVKVQPVIDLNTDPGVDGYEIPAGIRRQVGLRDPFCTFPFSSRRSGGLDCDHTIPFDHGPDAPPKQTRASNLGPVSRTPHRAKTHGGWRLEQPRQGVFVWRSPLGFVYRVQQGRTWRIGPNRSSPNRSNPDHMPSRIDLNFPRIDIHYHPRE